MIFKYRHTVLAGTPYEAGRRQGEFLASVPEAAAYMIIPKDKLDTGARSKAGKMIEFHDRYCPGLNEEIKGMTDSLGAGLEQAAYYHFPFVQTGCCSHFAVLPAKTADGHVYVGRSYEWSTEDEMRLCTARLTGRASHIGFSVFMFGRFDGMNEHGLSATMSAGLPGSAPEGEGCMFWSVVRTVLDRARSVDEGLDIVMDIPSCYNWNLILADKTGKAALVEIAGNRKREVKLIDSSSPEQYICSTNHYTLPGMTLLDTRRMSNSFDRYEAITKTIGNGQKVGRETLQGLLSRNLPEGVCCHYYSDWLGTLWSIIFDLSEKKADVCFGSPAVNQWRSFGLDEPEGTRFYDAELPHESVADPQTFFGSRK